MKLFFEQVKQVSITKSFLKIIALKSVIFALNHKYLGMSETSLNQAKYLVFNDTISSR